MKTKIFTTIIVLMMLVGSAYANDANAEVVSSVEEGYVGAIKSDSWKNMTYLEQVTIIDTDMSVCKTLETSELLELAYAYPFNMDFYLFDSNKEGIEHLINTSNVFKELLSRVDFESVLVTDYLNMKVNYSSLGASTDNPLKDSNYDNELLAEACLQYLNEKDDVSTHNNTLFEAKRQANSVVKRISALEGFYMDVPEVDRIINGASFVKGKFYRYGTYEVAYMHSSGDFTANEKTSMVQNMHASHPSWVLISQPTKKYNCHSYAWVTTATSNVYLVESPMSYATSTFFDYWGSGYITQANSKVVLLDGTTPVHSVISDATASDATYTTKLQKTYCKSKLGAGGVYKTTLKDVYDFYGASNYKIYTLN